MTTIPLKCTICPKCYIDKNGIVKCKPNQLGEVGCPLPEKEQAMLIHMLKQIYGKV
jgi:hypothetical protein